MRKNLSSCDSNSINDLSKETLGCSSGEESVQGIENYSKNGFNENLNTFEVRLIESDDITFNKLSHQLIIFMKFITNNGSWSRLLTSIKKFSWKSVRLLFPKIFQHDKIESVLNILREIIFNPKFIFRGESSFF
jgi:hypothetical protein